MTDVCTDAVIESTGRRLTPVQARVWFFHQLDPTSPLCRAAAAVRVRGRLDDDGLRAAAARLVDRHGALRGRVLVAGGPPEIVADRHARLELSTVDAAGHGVDQLLARLAAAPLPVDRAPLARLHAVRLGGSEHALLLVAHRLVLDTASVRRLLRELACGDVAPGADPPATEPAPRDGASIDEALDYWERRLRGVPRLHLPGDRPRPAVKTFGSRRFDAPVRPATVHGIDRLAADVGCGRDAVLLAAYAELLGRYTGQDDIVVGVPAAGRPPAAAGPGSFEDVAAIRIDRAGGRTARELVATVAAALREARSHPAPFHEVVHRLRAERDLSRTPVFSAFFEPQPPQPPLPAGYEWLPVRLGNAYDLTLAVVSGPAGMTMALDYNTDLFDDWRIQGMATHYLNVLDGVAGGGVAGRGVVDRAEMLSAAELRLLETWNGSGVADAGRGCLHELALADRAPAASPAVVGTGGELSRADLRWWSAVVARELSTEGVRPGDLVGVVMERGWEQVAGVLGVMLAGAGYVPVDPEVPQSRLAELLDVAGCRWVVTQPWLVPRVQWPAGTRLVVVGPQAAAGADARPAARTDAMPVPGGAGERGVAYVVFTSGSTGMPKGVVVDHRGAVNTVSDINARFGIGPGDRVLALSSLSFDLSVYDIFGMLAAGGTVVMPPASAGPDPGLWARWVSEHGVTVWNSVPALMELLVSEVEARPIDLSSLRLVLMSGDWIPVGLPDRIRAVAPNAQVISLGGATEGSIWSIWYPVGEVDPRWESIPYGRPLSGQQFFILDKALRPVPAGVVGELYIGGIGVALGYWAEPVRTATSFVPHPVTGQRLYRTGDLGRWRPDGVIEFLGRADTQVKVRGFRIELGEIEAHLARHPGMRDCVVTARGRDTDRRLIAYYVPAEPPPDPAELREWLTRRLPAYLVPTSYHRLAALPLTANGKVDRANLPTPVTGATGDNGAGRQPPSTPTQRLLAALWADALDTRPIGIHDDFFQLGGDSILGLTILSRLAEHGHRLRPAQFFRAPTVAEQAALLDRGSPPETGPATGPQAAPASGPDGSNTIPLSGSQQGMLFHSLLDSGQGFYVEQYCYRLSGELDLAAFAGACDDLTDRHELLRAAVAWEPDGTARFAVRQRVTVPIAVHDLSGTDERDQQRQIESFLASDRRRGFDLDDPPLVRLTVFRLGDAVSELLWTFHHVILDGWSVATLEAEFAQLYSARRAGRPARLPAPPRLRPYADWLAAQDASEAERFWRAELAGLGGPTPMAARAPAGPSDTVESDTVESDTVEHQHPLGEELSAALADLARTSGLTASTVLLAAWALLVARSNGPAQEAVFGLTLAGRPADVAGMDRAVGSFVTTVPLRVPVDDSADLVSWLRTVQDRQLEVASFGHVALADIRAWSTQDRAAPMFDSIVAFQTHADGPSTPRPDGLRVRRTRVVERTNFPLAVVVWPGRPLRISFQYDTAQLDAAGVRRIARDFERVLAAVVRGGAVAAVKLEHDGRDHGGHVMAPAPLGSAPGRAVATSRPSLRPPTTPTERQLTAIWSQVLDTNPIGVDDDFFQLGGDSIRSLQVVSLALRAGLRITPRQVLSTPTIAELAEAVGAAADPDADVPLTPVQHWFFEQERSEPHHFNQSVMLAVPGGVPADVLQRALQAVVHEHEALRSTFHREPDGWRLRFERPRDGEPRLRRVDLSRVPAADRRAVVAAESARLQGGLRLDSGCLLHGVLFDHGPGEDALLLLVAHHAVVDGVSWRVLVEDLDQVCAQLVAGQPPRLPAPTSSYRSWAHRLSQYAGSSRCAAELGFWLRTEQAPPPLPRDHPPAARGADRRRAAGLGQVRTVTAGLDEQHTDALLRRVPSAYRTQINDVLLAALGIAVREWTGRDRVFLDLEGHGREDLFPELDLTRTVGWFTSMTPLDLAVGEPEPGALLVSVKEQLRALPHRGIGYGVLRYLSDRRQRLSRLPVPELSFNYLGRYDRALSGRRVFGQALDQPRGPERSPADPQPHLLEVTAMVVAGRLVAEWAFHDGVHSAATVERLAERFVTALRDLVEHCRSAAQPGYSPADFPLAGLSQDDLDRVVAAVSEPKGRAT